MNNRVYSQMIVRNNTWTQISVRREGGKPQNLKPKHHREEPENKLGPSPTRSAWLVGRPVIMVAAVPCFSTHQHLKLLLSKDRTDE